MIDVKCKYCEKPGRVERRLTLFNFYYCSDKCMEKDREEAIKKIREIKKINK